MRNKTIRQKLLLSTLLILSLTLVPTMSAQQQRIGSATVAAVQKGQPVATADKASPITEHPGRLAQEGEPVSAADQMQLPPTPAFLDRVASRSSGSPDKLDATLRAAGVPARLMNFNLASPHDLSAFGLGKVLFIPVQVSNRPDGRSSTYFLPVGKETLTGIYVNGTGVALQYVKRVSGRGIPAKVGDKYSMRVTNLDGVLLYQGDGMLAAFDAWAGAGRIKYEVQPGGNVAAKTTTETVSIFWSCFSKTKMITE